MSEKYRLDWDINSELLLNKKQLNDIIKFHNKTIFTFHNKVPGMKISANMMTWLKNNEFKQTIPQGYIDVIELEKIDNKDIDVKSIENSHLDNEILFFELSKILNNSFKFNKGGNKIYPSAGALYPINVLLIVINSEKVERIEKNGVYLYDAQDEALILYKAWDEKDISDFKRHMNCEENVLGNICIAYSLDLRKSILKYEYRGYRHGLIEVGLMAQSLRMELHNLGKFKERCWSGFSDNSLTKLCGLNVRNSPIIMTQWIDKYDI
ncbi:nitroreductase family protein [Macrococcoides caseolyticum]|nr:SagB/ThcOx family dehydrogenase [Macrococcus caseolyticus]RKO14001.1 SagB/ThcOx family dehydrogenase [Macrococcus caseolyticus]